MDVALPIVSVIPSLDGPVLAALAGTTAPLRLTDVARRVDQGSRSGVRKVLLRLAAAGIVHEVPGGFVLNRDHVAAGAIEALATLHGELAQRLGSRLDEWGDVLLAGIFGSAARRDGDEDSDIDVLVVAEGSGLDELGDDLADLIARWTGNRAQVIVLTLAQLQAMQRAEEPIVTSWNRELVVVRGDRGVLRGAA